MNLRKPSFLFSFPDGPPGIGLLILRLNLASGLSTFAVFCSPSEPKRSGLEISVELLVLAASGLLAIGSQTHFVGIAVAAWLLFAFTPWAPFCLRQFADVATMAVFAFPVAVAIVLLGPGAFSLDAYRFGRKEIVIPAGPRSFESR